MALDTILQVLSGGSDIALIAIAYAIWKLDRRLFKLELLLLGEGEKDELV